MTSLIEDCQAWIDKGQESWKSFFSKWETFAEYEETLPESELIREPCDKYRERRHGNQKLLKLPLVRKKLKRVSFKNLQRKQKRLMKKKKNCQKSEAETRNQGNENLVELLENKQLEITLMTIFSDLLKANTNKYELFAVLFQTFTGREVTVKESDHLLSRQQVLPYSDFERRVANLSFENQRVLSLSMPRINLSLENQRLLSVSMPGNRLSLENQRLLSVSMPGNRLSLENQRLLSVSMPGNRLSLENQRLLSVSMPGNNLSLENQRLLSVSMPGNSLSLENQRLLSVSMPGNSLNGRSICPPRNFYLQSLNENFQESNSEQMQSNLRQYQNPRVGARNANNVSQSNFCQQQSLTSDGSQTPIQEKRSNLPYKSDLFRIKISNSVEFDSNHKFPKSFFENNECVRSATISELSITQKDRRLGNLSLLHRTNRISLSMDNANLITAKKKLSEYKRLSKMPSQKRHSSKKLISNYKESDSDSDDQTKYHSPHIHHKNKRVKADEQVIDALEPDADDCQHIFDRVMKS